MNIYEKMLSIQKLRLSFDKDANNPFFKSKYISLDNIVDKLTPVCDNVWLLISHRTENKEVITSVIDVETDIYRIESRFPLIESQDPQKLGSCITYAKRYNLGQIFNIVTDRDDDWNAASDKKVEEKESPPTCEKCGWEMKWSENKQKWYCLPCVEKWKASQWK